MEIKETGIAQWVESRQIPDDLVPVVVNAYGKGSFDTILNDYQDRIEETKRKIASLMFTKDLAPDWSSQLGLIYSVLGLYTISGGVAWRRNVDNITSLPDHVWYDYLGEQTRIREVGGTVIVMLSNEGVSYLNDIANELSSCTTTE